MEPRLIVENANGVGRFYTWHASHLANGKTEIFCDESLDGSAWTTRHATTSPRFRSHSMTAYVCFATHQPA